MATKSVCDRCGAEINPSNSVTYAGMRRVKSAISGNDYELCVSCAHELRKWFDGEEKVNRDNSDVQWCLSELQDMLAVDVAPVVHGRWNIMDGYKVRRACSVCGWDVPEYGKFYSYCPNCGAKMDGGDGDAAD